MKVIIDIEANGLRNPTKIWVIVCKEVESGQVHIFRRPSDDEQAKQAFLSFAKSVTLWIGHNLIEYDCPVIRSLLGYRIHFDICFDTLIVSRLVNYSRPGGHSIEQYGIDLGIEKGKFNDWTKYSQEMEDYCIRDVQICLGAYLALRRAIADPCWRDAIWLEQRFQLIVNDLHNNGFAFNKSGCSDLLDRVTKELAVLDEKILAAFPPKEVLIREFTPKLTKFGTISRTSVPRALHHEIHKYESGQTYRHTRLETFNPSSHKQLIGVLNEAGWKPEEKTQTHIDIERDLSRLKYERKNKNEEAVKDLSARLLLFAKTGWKINELNLSTLPSTAPEGAKLLAKRILLESRRRTLTEWLGLVEDDGRIHGKFVGIGAWTHRMAHQKPNTANIPREFLEDGSIKLYGKEMRKLWVAPRNRLLVGVDAEGIQLRIFAHYINDQEFTDALVNGRKANKTDPHSLNQRILGNVCKTRQAAKRFVYALLLGGGLGKLAVILGCSVSEAKEALDRLLQRYAGFAYLRKKVIPGDARRGYFTGVDGRLVPLPGETQRDREHLCMSGYLQNGEAIIVKKAAIIADDQLKQEKNLKRWMFVDIVHDELQSEVYNDVHFAERIAKIKVEAIVEAGRYYKLKCPMAGSYFNEDTQKPTIGTNWYATH